MATCIDVSGATYPQQYNAKPITPLEGKSLVPAFKNDPISRDALFWEHEGNAAIRVGDLKLVRQGRTGPWELYNLKSDRTELHNLANAQPEKAQELANQWEAWAERAHVKPYPIEGKAKKKSKGKKNAE
jgi:arylsulfatase